MGVTGDARGYYAVLGLAPGAPITTVKTAFRRLAKECHPDRAHVCDGGARFREISEAYEVLSDEQLKSAYDSATDAPTSPPQQEEAAPDPVIEPTCCQVCGKVTAQPRRLAFWRVTSFLLASWKSPVQKIYCQSCASREQWKSTIWTALLGWWGIPWGPIWSISHGVTNALGGTREPEVDEALMWRNAIAFTRSGQGSLAVGLSNILRKSDDADLAHRSAELIRFFSDRGVDVSTTLKEVWKRSVVQTIALLAILCAVPGAALALMFGPSGSPSPPVPIERTSAASDASVDGVFDDLIPANSVAPAETKPVPVPTCATPPSNGAILADTRGAVGKGHVLKIDNGSRGDAIIKLRDAAADKLVASFFIMSGRSASLTGIPDGTYRIQYAFGGDLREDCRSFIELESAGQFPDTETLQTEYRKVVDGTEVIRGELSYTLYDVPGGNVRPQTIDAAEFNKP